MKAPNLTAAAAVLLMDLVERASVSLVDYWEIMDVEAFAILRAHGLADVRSNSVMVASLGHRIAEALYMLWLHASRGDQENGTTRALRALVVEVVGAVPAEPPRNAPEPTPERASKTRKQRRRCV